MARVGHRPREKGTDDGDDCLGLARTRRTVRGWSVQLRCRPQGTQETSASEVGSLPLDERKPVVVDGGAQSLRLSRVEAVALRDARELVAGVSQQRRWLRPDDLVAQVVVLKAQQRAVFSLERYDGAELDGFDGGIWAERRSERIAHVQPVRDLRGRLLAHDLHDASQRVRLLGIPGRRFRPGQENDVGFGQTDAPPRFRRHGRCDVDEVVHPDVAGDLQLKRSEVGLLLGSEKALPGLEDEQRLEGRLVFVGGLECVGDQGVVVLLRARRELACVEEVPAEDDLVQGRQVRRQARSHVLGVPVLLDLLDRATALRLLQRSYLAVPVLLHASRDLAGRRQPEELLVERPVVSFVLGLGRHHHARASAARLFGGWAEMSLGYVLFEERKLQLVPLDLLLPLLLALDAEVFHLELCLLAVSRRGHADAAGLGGLPVKCPNGIVLLERA